MAFNQLTGLAVAEAIKCLKSSDHFESLPKSAIDGNQRFRLGEDVLRHISGLLIVIFKFLSQTLNIVTLRLNFTISLDSAIKQLI